MVEKAVGWVEGAVVGEGCRGKGKEEDGVEAEVDSVFGYVDKEEGKHARESLTLGSGNVWRSWR